MMKTSLPKGWSVFFDATGQTLYGHLWTGWTSWDPPLGSLGPASRSRDDDDVYWTDADEPAARRVPDPPGAEAEPEVLAGDRKDCQPVSHELGPLGTAGSSSLSAACGAVASDGSGLCTRPSASPCIDPSQWLGEPAATMMRRTSGWANRRSGWANQGEDDDDDSDDDPPAARRVPDLKDAAIRMSLILRQYTGGYVSLSALHQGHEELKAWDYHHLQAIALHSTHRGSKRFEWILRADGGLAIKVPEHLRMSRKTRSMLDDRAAKRRRHNNTHNAC